MKSGFACAGLLCSSALVSSGCCEAPCVFVCARSFAQCNCLSGLTNDLASHLALDGKKSGESIQIETIAAMGARNPKKDDALCLCQKSVFFQQKDIASLTKDRVRGQHKLKSWVTSCQILTLQSRNSATHRKKRNCRSYQIVHYELIALPDSINCRCPRAAVGQRTLVSPTNSDR